MRRQEHQMLRDDGGSAQCSRLASGSHPAPFSATPSSLRAIKFYGKDGSSASLPPSAGMTGSSLLGYVLKAQGDFDYQFLQKNDASTAFNAVYINYDREKGEQTKKIIDNVSFGGADDFKLDQIDGTSTATASYVYPAKPGYLLLADFTKKQKTLAMKLVKVNN